MYRVDRDLWLWDELLVVICFQIPDVDSATLVSNNELSLGRNKAEEILVLPALSSPMQHESRGSRLRYLIGMQADTVDGRVHLENALALKIA